LAAELQPYLRADMRILIAWFLLVLFSTQAFPLQVWSSTIAQVQNTTTCADNSEEEKSPTTPKEGKVKKQNTLSEEDYDHVHHLHCRPQHFAQSDEELHHWPASLYALFKREVTTPPPNHC
jgi:hypothetical protein